MARCNAGTIARKPAWSCAPALRRSSQLRLCSVNSHAALDRCSASSSEQAARDLSHICTGDRGPLVFACDDLEECQLAAEVAHDQRGSYADVAGDLVEGDPCIAMAGEAPRGSLKNGRSGTGPAALSGGGSLRRRRTWKPWPQRLPYKVPSCGARIEHLTAVNGPRRSRPRPEVSGKLRRHS